MKEIMEKRSNGVRPPYARIAVERGGDLDNLTRDVLAAEALGYGCHYGDYKADYPNTRDTPLPVRTENMKTCPGCGKHFPSNGKPRPVYCSMSCQQRINAIRTATKYREKKAKEAKDNGK